MVQTAITLSEHYQHEKFDTGDVYSVQDTPIGKDGRLNTHQRKLSPALIRVIMEVRRERRRRQ